MAVLFSVLVICSAAPAYAAPVKILAMGDSITAGGGYAYPMDDPTWRYYLCRHLLTDPNWDVDFVGLHSGHGYDYPYNWNDDPGYTPFVVPQAFRISGIAYPGQDWPDQDTTGHTGDSIGGSYLGNNAAYTKAAMATGPDIVLVHLGTNDLGGWTAPETVAGRMGTLIDTIRAEKPDALIYVAQIIPLSDDAYGAGGPQDLYERVRKYNFGTPTTDGLPDVIAGRNGDPSYPDVTLVDMWTGYPLRETDLPAHLPDGTPPDYVGDQFIAQQWFAAIPEPVTAVLLGVGGLGLAMARRRRAGGRASGTEHPQVL